MLSLHLLPLPVGVLSVLFVCDAVKTVILKGDLCLPNQGIVHDFNCDYVTGI